VFTSLALAAAVHPIVGHGFFPFFFLIPIFWILVIVLIVVLVSRRRRHWARGGYGPWGYGGYGHGGWAQAQAARSAEATLAERFAQGDIDEKEYRARLEVLRASVPQPPAPPVK
jgi:putative membrane protein